MRSTVEYHRMEGVWSLRRTINRVSSCSITVLLLAMPENHSRTKFSKPEWAGLVYCAFLQHA